MKTIQCTRSQLVDAMHAVRVPYISAFAAHWEAYNNSKDASYVADVFLDATSRINIARKENKVKTFISMKNLLGDCKELVFSNKNALPLQGAITLYIKDGSGFLLGLKNDLPVLFEDDGAGTFQVTYKGDLLDHLFPPTE